MTLGYTDGKTKIKTGFVTLGILSIVTLTAFELRKVIAGPEIDLVCKTKTCDKVVTSENMYSLTGITSNISDIRIGNRKIYIDTSGKFNEYIVLYPGANTISISAKDRFGAEVKKDISVYYTGMTDDTTL